MMYKKTYKEDIGKIKTNPKSSSSLGMGKIGPKNKKDLKVGSQMGDDAKKGLYKAGKARF